MPRISADLQAEIDEALGDVSLNDDSFEQMLLGSDVDSAEAALEPESRQSGTVVKIHEDNVFFSVGARHEAVASLRQFSEPPTIGAQMGVVINRFNAEDGLYEVSVPGASMKIEDWSDLSEGIVVEAHVTGHNSGGLECTVGHIRGFIPASQISVYRVEDFDEYVDQKLQCVVTEANPGRRNLVLSRRAAIEREREAARQKLWEELEVGQVREGVVRRIQDFGAFVDIGGIDGLIHVSELSWDRVGHPSEVLEEGQTIQVRVEKMDREAERLGLSYRGVTENPWKNAEANYPVNSLVTGTVSRIMQFGAFVKLEPGVEGLVHISELAHHRVHRVSHIVKEGDEVEVKVLSVDADAQRMSLSLKAAHPVPQTAQQKKKPEDEVPDGTRDRAVPQRKAPLKGGVDRPSGGEQFGLNW
jgi:small subunit ribosomal protein S1